MEKKKIKFNLISSFYWSVEEYYTQRKRCQLTRWRVDQHSSSVRSLIDAAAALFAFVNCNSMRVIRNSNKFVFVEHISGTNLHCSNVNERWCNFFSMHRFVRYFIYAYACDRVRMCKQFRVRKKKQIDHKSRVIVYRQTKRKFYAVSLINMIIKKR